MLKKRYRLKENKDFRRLYNRGKAVKNNYMVLYALRNKKAPTACRIGFSVSKKLGGAVVRNRTKRKLRHAAMCFLPCNNVEKAGFVAGYDYVIIARQKSVDASVATLEMKFGELLAELHKQR